MRSLCKIKLLSHESRPATELQSFWTTVGIPCATLQYWNSNTCTNSPPAAGSDWNCPSACLESRTRTTVQEFVSGISSLGKHINDINNHHNSAWPASQLVEKLDTHRMSLLTSLSLVNSISFYWLTCCPDNCCGAC